MSKNIKIIMEATPEEVEMANFCITQFTNLLKENEKFRKTYSISPKDINDGESFRKELLKKLFNHETPISI